MSKRVEEARFANLTNFIGGEFVEGAASPFRVISPVDGAELGRPCAASASQVANAVTAAASACASWSATPAGSRAAILEQTAAGIEADLDRLATLITLDNGKTYGEAELDVHAASALLRSAAGWATRIKGTTLVDENGLQRLTWHEPVGVVAIFMPFNAPLLFCALKIGAAIAVGNTLVAKSSEQNPYAAVAFVEHLQKAGLPAGVVNLVQGGGEVGAALVAEPAVDMVSFTGSSHVGGLVGQSAISSHKRLLLELGGKSANIVFDDADLTAAVPGSVRAIFRNAGQRCYSGSRLLLQRGIATEFLSQYVEQVSALRVGDPFDPTTQVGTLITHADVDRVQRIVDHACEEGAKILCGGEPVSTDHGGAHYAPTVIDCSGVPEAGILQEEVFGPVVTVQVFDAPDEAIKLANSSRYALAGGCWTRDLGLAFSTARAVDAGMFWINSYAVNAGVEATIGGRGASGFGQEAGEQGVLAYTIIKSVLVDAGPAAALGVCDV